jgi:hypothetical protein
VPPTTRYDFSLKINRGTFTTAQTRGGSANVKDFRATLSITQPLFSRRAALGVHGAGRGRRGIDRIAAATVALQVLQAWLRAAEAYRRQPAAGADAAEHLRWPGGRSRRNRARFRPAARRSGVDARRCV